MIEVGICEDDDALRQILRDALARAGCSVRPTASGHEAVRAFADAPPAVLVLDIGLPDADGRDVCQALRARGVMTPVLFLTARDALPDRVSGFHAGGDDYLTKPFAMAELVVRVQALARRTPPGRPMDGGMVLDPVRHAIAGASPGQEVRLTPTEYRLLAHLCGAGGEVVRRSELVRVAWPDGAIVSDNTLDAYVSRLRTKLREADRPEELENIRGVGYCLR